MELCTGGSLTRWLTSGARPSQEQVRQVGLQVADTLAALHAAGLLHRDVKPANILIDGAGRFRLGDLGLAAGLGAEADPPGTRWMSPAWSPPEAFRMAPATEAGDVFSLAATLYALLAGRPPRELGSPDAPLEQLAEAVRAPIAPVPGCAGPLMDVVVAALDDNPARRPSAAALLVQLAKVRLSPPRRTHGGAAGLGVGAAGASSFARASSTALERVGDAPCFGPAACRSPDLARSCSRRQARSRSSPDLDCFFLATSTTRASEPHASPARSNV